MPAKMKQVDPELSAVEVAGRLNVTTRAITKWCVQGRFPGAYKVGNGKTSSWCIPQSVFDAYMKARLAEAAAMAVEFRKKRAQAVAV